MEIKITCSGAEMVRLDELQDFQGELKSITEKKVKKLVKAMQDDGFSYPFFYWEDSDGVKYVFDGHQRQRVLEYARDNGVDVPDEYPACKIEAKDKHDAARKLLAYNERYGVIDGEGLYKFMSAYDIDIDEIGDIELPDISVSDFVDSYFNDLSYDEDKKSLSDRFVAPPFSIFDARQGYWVDRKKEWLSLGIKSELGRDSNLVFSKSAQPPEFYKIKNQLKRIKGKDVSWDDVIKEAEKRGIKPQSGTSVFDPVLCEIAYKWFCPPGGVIIDPFCGGSVRGIVASYLGYKYLGVDLNGAQVEENKNQMGIVEHCENKPVWVHGDSAFIDELLPGDILADFIFTCPPYVDLEKYTDDPRDISNLEYDDFIDKYGLIIKKACSMLKEDRFACVVGEVRHKNEDYYNFVGDTIRLFIDAGLKYYNEAILITQTGSLPIRAARIFTSTRKLGKTHQNVLVFWKGDVGNIKEVFSKIDIELDENYGG